jgi:sec-independent protein translocase protein TatB
MGTPAPIQLAGLGMADSIILMVLALVVFGPRRLPQIGRQIGKLMFEFRKASNDFKFQMEEELRLAEEADRRKKEEAERQRVAALASANPPAPAPAQTVEAQADIGAVEPSTAPAESPSAEPRILPPQTGEQVSASAPFSGAQEEAVSGLNPEASAEADAASVKANGANPESNPPQSPPVESTPTPKEPVSQHG